MSNQLGSLNAPGINESTNMLFRRVIAEGSPKKGAHVETSHCSVANTHDVARPSPIHQQDVNDYHYTGP